MKVEWNKSPKPFSPTYDGQASAKKSKSDDCLTKEGKNAISLGKSASETVVPSHASSEPMDTTDTYVSTSSKTSERREEPSKRPLSAKLASFEQKITANTPALAKSTHVPKTPKQVDTFFF